MTGHAGYLGSVMAPTFLEAGYEVASLDTGYFEACVLVPDLCTIPVVRKDIRDLVPDDLDGFDAVVHLAALSNDPLGNLNGSWTEEINSRASVLLASLAKAAGVHRFLFSSSCIMYGMSEPTVVTEDSPLDPKTDYARSKVEAERAISRLAGHGFSPTFLRNGTVYGLSPRMRFDTVFNNLIGSAVATRKVGVHSDGKPWRPVVHIQDVARAFLAVLEAPIPAVHNQVFNVGANPLNHQVIELAEVAAKTVARCQLEVLAGPSADQRTYKTDFSKFARTFPQFKFMWTIADGAKELVETLQALRLSYEDLVDKRYNRLKWLQHLLDTDRVDDSLRWRTATQDEIND